MSESRPTPTERWMREEIDRLRALVRSMATHACGRYVIADYDVSRPPRCMVAILISGDDDAETIAEQVASKLGPMFKRDGVTPTGESEVHR